MDALTREIPILADLLLAIFPPTERPETPPISMFELAVDAIRVREIRGELVRTSADLPAIEDAGPHMVECSDCRGAGEYYVEGRDLGNGPDAGRIVTCEACGGAGEVDEDAV